MHIVKRGKQRENDTADCDMGRMRYSQDERDRMTALFVNVTRAIMDREGADQVSIRKVAKSAGYNSATMYLYFKDVDELITMASLSYLVDYCRALAKAQKGWRSARDTYIYAWEIFCRHAFLYPHVFYRIFFFQHSTPLEQTIERYYEIFPHQLDDIDGAVKQMLRGGTLESRDYRVLRPLVEEGEIGEQSAALVSTMAVGHFRQLLSEKCERGELVDDAAQARRQVEAVRFLLCSATDQ